MGTKNPVSIDLELSDKEIQKKAREAYDKGDYAIAYSLYFSLYNHVSNPPGLQLNIALCLIKMNRKRQARLFAYKELLDYPDNELAIRLLSDQSNKVTGKTIAQNFSNTTRPDHYPDISLVLIVKNEEKDLPRCLESFKDIVKEIIIVDTGSTDRTVEIAKSYGAHVEYYEWTNDFAEARNVSLKYATCEWVLRTDADEWIEEPEKAKLLHVLNSGLADVYLCPTVSKVQGGEQRVENVRLIKNHLGIVYNYPIHETVAISVNRLGLTQCLTNVEFLHSGYEFLEPGSGERKTERNINVCYQYLQKNPDDFYVRVIYGLFLLNTPRKEEAVVNIEAAIKNIPDDASPVKYTGLAYIALSQVYINQNKEIDLNNILLDAQIDFHIYSCMMQFVAQVYLYNKGDWKKANKILAWTLQRYSTKLTFSDILPPENFNEEQCLLMMADTSVLCKDYEKARKYYLKAKKFKALKKEEKESIVQVKDKNNSFQDIDSLSAEELRIFAKTPKENLKWIDTYRNVLRAASKSQLTAQDYLDLANCQIQLNDLQFAQLLIDEARMINSNLAMGTNLESLIALKQKDTQKGLEKAIEAFVMEPGNEKYQQNVEVVSELLKMTPVQAIRQVGLKNISTGKVKDGLFELMMYLKFQPDDDEIKEILSKYMD
jgi:glycosyltransferase involved in cell wall biosynthesis